MHLSAVLVDYTHVNDVPTMQYYLLHYLTFFSFDFHPSSTYFQTFRDDSPAQPDLRQKKTTG